MVFVDLALRCAECGSIARCGVVASAGAYVTWWTDGWSVPTVQRMAVIKCPACGRVAHRDDFEELGAIDHGPMRFAVELRDMGPRRVEVMAVVRRTLGRSPAETRALIGALPVTLYDDVWPHRAYELRDALIGAGASCTVREQPVGDPTPAAWNSAPYVVEVAPHDIAGLLAGSSLSTAAERDARAQLYQLFNHPYRGGDRAWVSIDERAAEQRDNARRLLALLELGADHVACANLLRERGCLAEASAALAAAPAGPATERIAALIDAGDTRVLPLTD